jgi:hypothetical protein
VDGAALNAPSEPLLFPGLLGAGFATLPPRVRMLHLHEGAQRLSGGVEVARGTRWLSCLCAWATRLPPAGHAPITVEIVAVPGQERWTRHVTGHAMPSRLWASGGLLCEKLGLVTFGFRLHAEDGAIVWRVERVQVLGLRLPAAWFEGVSARESEHDDRYHFDVSAALPLAGLLVRYRGWLHVD